MCCTCSADKKGCEHVTLLYSMKQKEYPSCLDKLFAQIGSSKYSATRSLGNSISPSRVSKTKIPFKPDRHTSEILRQGGIHHCVSRSVSQDGIILRSSLKSDKCPSCQNDWTFLTQQLPLVTEVTSLDVQGIYGICILPTNNSYHFKF